MRYSTAAFDKILLRKLKQILLLYKKSPVLGDFFVQTDIS